MSCVLHVSNGQRSALLAGDTETAQERVIVDQQQATPLTCCEPISWWWAARQQNLHQRRLAGRRTAPLGRDPARLPQSLPSPAPKKVLQRLHEHRGCNPAERKLRRSLVAIRQRQPAMRTRTEPTLLATPARSTPADNSPRSTIRRCRRSLQTQTNALNVIPLLLQTVKPQRQRCFTLAAMALPCTRMHHSPSSICPYARYGRRGAGTISAMLCAHCCDSPCFLHEQTKNGGILGGLLQRNGVVTTLHARHYA